MEERDDKDAGVSRRDFLKAAVSAGAFALVAGTVPSVVWAGNRPRLDLAKLGDLMNPYDVAFGPGGELAVANAGRYGVVRLAGADRTYIGLGAGTAPGKLNFPMGVDIGPDGLIYAADTNNGRIQVFAPGGGPVREFGRPGYLDGEFLRPKSVCAYRSGVLVADTRNHRIQYLDLAGERIGTKAPVTRAIYGGLGDGPGDLKLPRYVTCDGDGMVYVADAGHALIKVYAPDGKLVRALGRGTLTEPHGLAVAADGRLFAADAGAGKVFIFRKDGAPAGAARGLAGMKKPRGLAWFDGFLAVADPAAARIFLIEA